MLAFLSLVSALLVAPVVQAAPAFQVTGCSLAKANISALATQTVLPKPTGVLSSVSLGVGVQNYTCLSTGNYSSTGAVAELFDASCSVSKPEFPQMANMAFDVWSRIPGTFTAQQMISMVEKIPFGFISNAVVGQHYFVPNPAGGNTTSPKWDYTSSGTTRGQANAFVIAAKDATMPAPNAATDVAWLALHAVQGDLAKNVYRVYTRGGQPPASCTPGSQDISVRYTTVYAMYQ